MMKHILKYPLELGDHTETIEMPVGAEILTVQMQGLFPVIWAICPKHNSEPITRKRLFITYGTDQNIPEQTSTYIGTYQFKSFVGHVFEIH